MRVGKKKPLLHLLLVTLGLVGLSTALGGIEHADELVSSMTTGVLHLLDNLQNSHGETLNNVLTLLLDRVRHHNVTEEEANAIRDAVVFIDDHKAKEILDVVRAIVSTMSVDELLMDAFDVYDDFLKTDGDPREEGLPKIGFEGDNRTYVINQLDILVPEEDVEMDRHGRVKRKAVIDEERLLWKRGIIPYHIDEEHFSSAEQHLVKNAMSHWELYTCLEFREKRSTDFNSLLIHEDGRGCFSSAGQIGGTQHLVLRGSGCKRLPTIIHELGHAIGLYHEHTRTDRDGYVEIVWKNIKNILYYNDFVVRPAKHRIEDLVPYDYKSIMHYGTYFWARKARQAGAERPKTIRTKEAAFQDVIGKAQWASFNDIKTISLLYKCSEDCKPKKCPDDGFLGKRCTCWCRGPSDDIPVVECDKEVSCSPPPIDMNVYQVWQFQRNDRILEFTLDIPSGTKFNVDHADLRCGDALATIQCSHGLWDLPLPPCDPEPCFIEPEWLEIYSIEIEPTPELPDGDILQSNITHGSKIKLACISEVERQNTFKCSYGNWTDQPQICPEIGGRCLILNSSSIVFVLEATGEVLQPGDTVKHGYIVQAMCDPELTLYTDYEDSTDCQDSFDTNLSTDYQYSTDCQDYFDTNLTCSDGKLIGYFPTCPEPPTPCPEVSYGHMYTYLPFTYNVTCHNGYQLETERQSFHCDRNGTWFRPVPNCIKKNCTIPPKNQFKGTIKDRNGVILSEDSHVRSGDSVQFQCSRGFAPGSLNLTCNAEKWNTADGNLPVCKEVFCNGRPPVRNSSYAPHLRGRYRYGDVVRINRCLGNLEPVGPPDRRIECLANGSWSASFYCRKFCDGGTIVEVQFSNHMVKAKPVRSYTNVKNVKTCQKKCRKQKKFLCLSYLYGFDFDKRRWLCLHFKVDPSKNTELLEYKKTRFVFARTCVE